MNPNSKVDDFAARSPDELSLTRGDRIELIERDDEFGDGWFLGKHVQKGDSGLFPQGKNQECVRSASALIEPAVYTTLAPIPTLAAAAAKRAIQTTPSTQMTSDESSTTSRATASTGGSGTGSNGLHSSQEESSAMPVAQRSASDTAYYGTIAGRLGSASPSTPPPNDAARRTLSASAPRTLSMGSSIQDASPVMNETLSVIEEHITDMNTPRHSLLSSRDRTSRNSEPSRLSYINGHETDEEECGTYTEKEVLEWTPEQVAQLLEERGADQLQCQVFRDEEITGEVLLNLDQSSLMLKQFDLGKMGRRLALWHKIHDFQLEVRGPKPGAQHAVTDESGRNRSTSFGLPRIPSLMESTRTSSGHQMQRSISELEPVPDGATLPPQSDVPTHVSRPSAASVRGLNHNRRHSSIDGVTASKPEGSTALGKPAGSHVTHSKQGSFDRTWTMESSSTQVEDKTILSSHVYSPSVDSDMLPSGNELGMTVVSALDLDRGYFSGNEVENRRARNVLQKQAGGAHARAPSDSYGNKRTSHLFSHQRTGSTDSFEGSPTGRMSPAQVYYSSHRPGNRTSSSPQFSKTLQVSSSSLSPTVTKLEYGDSPSIDTIAASPNVFASETSSLERPTPSPAPPNRFTRYRATGLRAISDAVIGDEKSLVRSPIEKIMDAGKNSPIQTPSRTESSTPSVNSKSMDMDDGSLLKSGTGSLGSQRTPLASTSMTVPKRKHKKQTSAYMRGLEAKSPKEQMIGCDYSGWMKKKSSNLMTTWKTRLFVLRGRRLSYYYSEDDIEEKGLIDISFHRVLPANNDRITGIHAAVTGAAHSPTSPQNAHIETTAASDAARTTGIGSKVDVSSGMFIFKLVPPRSGLSKAVNFTKPTVHYFAVDNIQQGRLWMAALMKATIDRDESKEVVTTYNQKTISLAKAKAMRQRPPELMDAGEDEEKVKELEKESDDSGKGLGLSGLEKGADESLNGDKKEDGSFITDEAGSTLVSQFIDTSSDVFPIEGHTATA